MTQRDVFIGELFNIAKDDKDVIMISVDMGAPSLDQWRDELPNQFFATGISEQHSINFAAGLSAQGKKVYVYFMGAWVARCFEQIRYSCCMGENPITILGRGVGLGYMPAGPAHAPTEDIGYMRTLMGIEIYTPHNLNMTKSLVNKSYEESTLKYIRLERNYDIRFDNSEDNHETATIGIHLEKPGLWNNSNTKDLSKIALVSCGYLLGRCLDVWEKLQNQNYEVSLYNLYRTKPNPIKGHTFDGYTHIVSVEEQTLSGGMGSVILEGLSDYGVSKKVLRLGLPERHIFENGSRDYHIDNNELSVTSIINKIKEFVNEKQI